MVTGRWRYGLLVAVVVLVFNMDVGREENNVFLPFSCSRVL